MNAERAQERNDRRTSATKAALGRKGERNTSTAEDEHTGCEVGSEAVLCVRTIVTNRMSSMSTTAGNPSMGTEAHAPEHAADGEAAAATAGGALSDIA